jgi:1-deoxy-D-xylulose-5-phosphate reductoisomerase
LNAADEVAVAAFLDRRIAFPDIAAVVDGTLQKFPAKHAGSIGDILSIDADSRALAHRLVSEVSTSLENTSLRTIVPLRRS